MDCNAFSIPMPTKKLASARSLGSQSNQPWMLKHVAEVKMQVIA
jgi:hypothetical protein